MILKYIHRYSKLFQPIISVQKNLQTKHNDITSKSQRLMLDMGIIKPANPGCYHLLPLGRKALHNLIELVDNAMYNVDAQKVTLASLTNSQFWIKSGRFVPDKRERELFTLQDRHNHEYILSPTFEEAATELLSTLATSPISYKTLPLRLYQTTRKYRDEMKPRFGLMRAREFYMKDLYSYDIDFNSAEVTYQKITDAYLQLFKLLGIDVVRVNGCSGTIGGDLSHEYHIITDIGEDRLVNCTKCNYHGNIELSNDDTCPKCGHDVKITNGIEVAHTFLFGDKYSKPLQANYLNKDGKPTNIYMGSYGIGLSRLLGAVVELKSSEHEIVWPFLLAPYKVLIVIPKRGSKEQRLLEENSTIELYNKLSSIDLYSNSVLLDDRDDQTIGRRVLDAKRSGFPYIVVLGNTLPKYELIDVCSNAKHVLTPSETYDYLLDVANKVV